VNHHQQQQRSVLSSSEHHTHTHTHTPWVLVQGDPNLTVCQARVSMDCQCTHTFALLLLAGGMSFLPGTKLHLHKCHISLLLLWLQARQHYVLLIAAVNRVECGRPAAASTLRTLDDLDMRCLPCSPDGRIYSWRWQLPSLQLYLYMMECYLLQQL